ncbi:MAG: sulfatase [Luteolibacter sp.]
MKFALGLVSFFLAATSVAAPLNIVLITADDMNWDSTGVNGCSVPNITPHIDKLASEGILMREAHSTIPVCQPVRATMHTGMYPQNNGARGFEPIKDDVQTINEILHENGYLISMLAKTPHYKPTDKYHVDYLVHAKELDVGRNPKLFRKHTAKFLAMAKEQGKPFFHHVNCQDPHRPFAWTSGHGREGKYPPISRRIKPDEVEIPKFLENFPEIRQEVADYYSCVHRFDECVGAVLDELKKAGHDQETLVMLFAGDHGMAFPFAKANVYANSSKATMILRWPKVIPAGKVDDEHLVATIDMAPTLLDAAKLPALEKADGRSFLKIAQGEKQKGWEEIITMFHRTSGKNELEMRCVRTKDAAYIWNAWSNGTHQYRAENMTGVTWKRMLEAAETDSKMKERCDYYIYRTPQEYYVVSDDAAQRNNLINDPNYADEIAKRQKTLEKWLTDIKDPLLGSFREMMRK